MKKILQIKMDEICHKIKIKASCLCNGTIPNKKKAEVLMSLYLDIDTLNDTFTREMGYKMDKPVDLDVLKCKFNLN